MIGACGMGERGVPDDIGLWRIRDFDPGAGLAADAARGAGDRWVAAQVPGDTYDALIAAGRLAHPYEARNEAPAAWVRTREWWWHAPVDLGAVAAGEWTELVFAGLDTFADVYLDGILLGRADNMFREWRFDLTGFAGGRHDLAICFHPPALMTGDAPLPVWPAFTDRVSASRRTAMRKAQFGWGWDWGPDLPTVGIWQPVAIVRRRAAEVRSLNFSTLSLTDGAAQVRVDVDVSEPAPVAIELLAPDGASVATASCDGSGAVTLTVRDPQLWWSAGLGEQPLYTLVARIDGALAYERKVGIRTIAIDQSPDPDEPGTTFFRFVLNGVPIFAKGANWVPASSFVGAIPDATYTDLLERAVAANMNMMRVWGGGLYEPDIFYDECDRLGLLVWQDFMFACAPYPEDDAAFVDNVRVEIEEQVARLRHHACLALWCGNNENQAIHWFNDLANGTPTPLVGAKFYDAVIPDALARLDPDTPYWPGSPTGGPTPNSMRGGDEHNWTVWHGVPPVPDADPADSYQSSPEGVAYTRYAEDKARFVSEFGLQGAADLATLQRWMAPEDMVLGSDGFLERIKDVADKASAMMIPATGLPSDFADFVDFTQLAQAEGLKFGIEHFRRRMPHCSGALIWQHNDCWPCVSWSLIDYDGVAKASFYATRRAFAPVMASFRRDGDRIELWVVNDTLATVRDTATVTLARLSGGEDWREEVAFEVPANASRCVWTGVAAEAFDQVPIVRSAGGLFPANRVFPPAVKDLVLADPELAVATEPRGDALAVIVTARRYALAVRLSGEAAGLRFDDNCFDLAAGESRTVVVTRTGGSVTAAEIRVASWWDRAHAA